jgi:hypothetical protein
VAAAAHTAGPASCPLGAMDYHSDREKYKSVHGMGAPLQSQLRVAELTVPGIFGVPTDCSDTSLRI